MFFSASSRLSHYFSRDLLSFDQMTEIFRHPFPVIWPLRIAQKNPAIKALYEESLYKNGKILDIVPLISEYETSRGLYLPRCHTIKINFDYETNIQSVLIHELRHAWQNVSFGSENFTNADPYTHFLYSLIIEADAFAFTNLIHNLNSNSNQNYSFEGDISKYIDLYKKEFMDFFLEPLFTVNGYGPIDELDKIDTADYVQDSLSVVFKNAQPFFEGRSRLKPYNSKSFDSQNIERLLLSLKISGLTEDPLCLFTEEEAHTLTEKIAKHYQNFPKVRSRMQEIENRL